MGCPKVVHNLAEAACMGKNFTALVIWGLVCMGRNQTGLILLSPSLSMHIIIFTEA